MQKVSLLFAALLLINACALMEKVTDYAEENDVVVRIAISQGILRFIDKAEDKQSRAQAVVDRLADIEKSIDDSEAYTINAIFVTINEKIDWSKLSIADQVLIKELLAYVKTELQLRLVEQELSPEALLTIKGLLQTARSYASMYL